MYELSVVISDRHDFRNSCYKNTQSVIKICCNIASNLDRTG